MASPPLYAGRATKPALNENECECVGDHLFVIENNDLSFSGQCGRALDHVEPPQLTLRKVHLLRAPTKTSPNPPSSDNVLRMGEIGRVLFCSWET